MAKEFKEKNELEIENTFIPPTEEDVQEAVEKKSRRQTRKARLQHETAEKNSGRHKAHKERRSSAVSKLMMVLAAVFVIGLIIGAAGNHILAKRRTVDANGTVEIQITSEQERLDGIKWAFSVGANILETLRKYYPTDIVMYKNGKYVFEPIDTGLKMHDYDSEKVRKNTDGTWGYVDGDRKVWKGIDVSSHQGEIDWGKVAYTNVQFAMIRAMYRGYESGKLVEDKQFRYNIENAKEKAIKVGVYVFTQAVSTKEVDEEVNMLCGLLGPYDLDLPVVVDVEAVGDDEARMDNLTKEERTEIVKYYCEKLEKSGYKPMIYYNIDGAVNMVDVSKLEAFDKWFAVYDSNFYYPYAYQMWQYKDTGRVDGIDGNVDFDLYFPED